MIRVSIAIAAFDAICAALPLGGASVQAEANEWGKP